MNRVIRRLKLIAQNWSSWSRSTWRMSPLRFIGRITIPTMAWNIVNWSFRKLVCLSLIIRNCPLWFALGIDLLSFLSRSSFSRRFFRFLFSNNCSSHYSFIRQVKPSAWVKGLEKRAPFLTLAQEIASKTLLKHNCCYSTIAWAEELSL